MKGHTSDAPQGGLVLGAADVQKLEKRLSRQALAIALATQTGIQDEELYNSSLGKLWMRFMGRTDIMAIVLPIFVEPAFRSKARFWAAVYVFAMLAQSIVQVQSTDINLNLTSSMEWMDSESFYYWLFMWFACQTVSLFRNAIQATARWELRMAVQWRLQFRMGHAFFSSNTFHIIQNSSFKVDASQDIPNPAPESLLCRDSYLWLAEFTVAVDTIISECIMLVTAIYTVSRWSYTVTLYMLISVPIRGFINFLMLPRALMTIHRTTIATNWDLMFILGRVQDQAEQIALLRGSKAELQRFTSTLNILLRNHLVDTLWTNVHQLGVLFVGTVFMFPVLVKLMYQVCDDGLSVSAAMTYSTQSLMVQAHLSMLSGSVALFMRYQQTVENMVRLIKDGTNIANLTQDRDVKAASGAPAEDCILVKQRDPLDNDGAELELRDVTLVAPTGQRHFGIASGINLQLTAGQSLLVVGDTGVGKSALLRAIHGFWWCGKGYVHRCPNSLLSCMPERPFTFAGSLRDNLLYPEAEEEGITDPQILQVLEDLHLTNIVRSVGLDRAAPWHSILSLGQQQRLGFARILLRPSVRLVLLDEATSALDMKNERKIYGMLKERFPCYVSVGHRPSVREYHTHVVVLRFRDDRSVMTSNFSFMPLADFDFNTLKDMKLKHRPESAEEKAWAAKAVTLSDQRAKPANEIEIIEEQEEDDGVDLSKMKTPELISLHRHWGGFSLVTRALGDIVWPMLTQREVVLPIGLVFGVTYSFSYASLAMESWFGYPYSQVINVLQTRSTTFCWSFFFKVICFYYPCSVLFIMIARIMVVLQGHITRVTIKWYLAKSYLSARTDSFYHMSVTRVVSGNPGTRITAWDADAANAYIISLVSTFTAACFGVFISTRSLYNLNMTAFWLCIIYLIGGVIFYICSGTKVFDAYVRWLELTMDLYNGVLHTREHSEAICLLQGSNRERRAALQYFDEAITPGQKYLWRKDASKFWGDTYFNQVADSVLHVVTGPMVLTGSTTFFGQNQIMAIIKAGSIGVHMMLVESLLNVEGQAAMERVWELQKVMLHIQGSEVGQSRFGGDIKCEEDPDMELALELRNVSLRTPVSSSGAGGATLLVKNVNLKVPYADSLLIAGESGIGKSSMLRAVAGLWRHGWGTIRASDDRKSFFIPQRPYMFVGNLRENLLYPEAQRTDISDETLASVAKLVGLEHLLVSPGLGEERRKIEERADVNSEKDRGWFWRLSLGEMQRLNFGRLFLKQDVRVVFLDEATSALSIDVEEAMYTMLKDHVGSYISVAHRPQLRRFHKRAFVMLTDHNTPLNADCRTVCHQMQMDEYEQMLKDAA